MRNQVVFRTAGIAALTALALLAASAQSVASDWSQFMGPNGDGTSPEKGLARAFPETGPTVLWTSALGQGYGPPAVRDGKVYVLDRAGREKDTLRCLDLGTGKEEWTFAYEAPGSISHDGSRSTPAVSATHVYTIGPFGHFHCIDRATHKHVWKKNVIADFGGKLPRWACAQSPLLYKDMVIVAPQTREVGLAAFDQKSGTERWRSGSVGTMAYGSPMTVSIGGIDHMIIVTAEGAAGVSAADGKVLWRYGHPCRIAVPNVTSLGDGRLFVTGGYNAGSAIVQVAKSGEVWSAKELARIDRVGGHCHPALLYQDHLYMLANTNERSDGMVCFALDGKIVWQTNKNPYLCKGGSILTADGIIYVMDGGSGELHIVEPSPTAFKSLAKAKVLDGREIWGPLALAGGKLLIRDQRQMKCIDLGEK